MEFFFLQITLVKKNRRTFEGKKFMQKMFGKNIENRNKRIENKNFFAKKKEMNIISAINKYEILQHNLR